MLWNFKSFSQSSTATVEPVAYDDSLVCFPKRYLMFMVDDIKQGRKDKVKVEELQQAVQKKDEEFRQTKSRLASETGNTSMLRDSLEMTRDSLEMKNSLIMNLHTQKKQLKTRITVWQGLALVATILFAVK